MRSRRSIITRLAVVMSLVAPGMVVAACGSDDNGAATSTGSNANAGVVSQAKVDVSKYLEPVRQLDIAPLAQAAPKGVRLTLISCPSCTAQDKGVTAAAKALGWQLKIVTPKMTPESYVSAWTSVVQAKPDAIIGVSPFPLDAMKRQLDAAKQAGITVVTQGASTYPVGGDSAVVADGSGANVFTVQGELYADVPIADAGKAPNAVLVVDGAIPAWKVISGAFQKRITAAGAKFRQLDVSLASAGKDAPSQIVSYLQRSPDVDYVVLVVPAYYIGLKQALKSAGLDKVKIVIGAADSTIAPLLENGDVLAGVGLETLSGAWRLVDAVARKLTDSDMSCCTHIGSSYLVVQKSNAALAAGLSDYPNRYQDFRAAWKVE